MNRILSNSELGDSSDKENFSAHARALLRHQWEHFPLAKQFHDALSGICEKQFTIDELEVRVQFNPARIISSAAKVDDKTISERKCFLCEANLPVEQRALAFGEDYLVLCNPFLIFPQHLTIPHRQHTDQRIRGRLDDMLNLSKALSDFIVFYNGPKCGASAPDHFHFQAGNKGFVPLETEFDSIVSRGALVSKSEELEVHRIKPFGANAFVFLSENPLAIELAFYPLYGALQVLQIDEPEPMMNLLSWYDGMRYCLVVFPRKLHRPTQFFAEGDDNILLSPASVDLAGLFITPLEKDFLKITPADIQDILSQIVVNDETMEVLEESIKLCL